MKKFDIVYVVSNLKKVGPTNQTLNIIKAAKEKYNVGIITLFEEDKDDTMIELYKNENIEIISCLKIDGFVQAILKGKRKLLKELKKISFKCIHSYGILPDYLSSVVCKKKKKIHIITLRNFPKEDILTRMNFLKGHYALHIHLKTLKKCNYLISCSESIKTKMEKTYKWAKVTAIQNGVDVERFSFNNIVQNNEKVFLCASSIIKRKRIDETIEGFIKSKHFQNSKLQIIGDGELLSTIKEKYKIPNIEFIGKVQNIEDYYKKADVFLSSSESEGLPNSLIESISMGLIPVVSNIPQHLEVLNKLNFKSYHYELGNIDDLVKSLNDIEFNVDKRLIRSEIINSDFNSKINGKRYLEYYERII